MLTLLCVVIVGVKEGFEERISKSYTITKAVKAKEMHEDLPASGRELSHATTYHLVGGETPDNVDYRRG